MSQSIPRRGFLAGSLAATAALGASALKGLAADGPRPAGKRDVYELRVYQVKSGDMMKRAEGYFQNALLPALRRAGTGPVGVFSELNKSETPVYLLIPHGSLESVIGLSATLRADDEYQKAGADFLKATPKDPAYTNLEARLMLAAEFIPQLQVPPRKDTRIFELRRYRNPSEAAFRKKLEMFGQAGELAIFRKVGLNPVFFGEMLIGPDMPNITYMLTNPDQATHTAAWRAFGQDPDWRKLSRTPGYTDPEIIANIQNWFLKPASYSQI